MTLLANFVALPACVRPPMLALALVCLLTIAVLQQSCSNVLTLCCVGAPQVALVLPFMRLGELLLDAPYLPITPVSIKDVIWHHQGEYASTGDHSEQLQLSFILLKALACAGEALKAIGHAMLGWALCFPFITCIMALVLQPVLGFLQRRCWPPLTMCCITWAVPCATIRR